MGFVEMGTHKLLEAGFFNVGDAFWMGGRDSFTRYTDSCQQRRAGEMGWVG